MSRAFKPRLEVLPAAQRRIWPELKGLAAVGFVLYGGTAIALRLGHRFSIDFDFLTDRALDRRALQKIAPAFGRATFLQEMSDTVTALVPIGKQRVKISLFAGLRIGRVGRPDWTDDGVLQVAAINDLMATKLKVLLQRVEAKDYLDIAAMLEHGADLAIGLANARALYGRAFQPTECLKALIYFKEGDLRAVPRATRSRLIAAVNAVRDLPKARRLSRSLSIPASNRPRG
ncbi:MAG TPA: nucleotidyl transferase AbiEii/AbiGii toxin family protein [Dongiaceae bacterium]|nr:nucleotidyl transferase AbiEii/AbiGii toxin family protein [Dongiaceae bacterium]